MKKKISLETRIRKIVEDHSGGMKFTELITDLVKELWESQWRKNWGKTVNNLGDNFPEKVENVIRKSKKLKILDYTWKSMNRAKMFIYTP